jgi:putative membrane protein insertion efficiency factor
MKYVLMGLIRLYQLTFSRLLPENTCRFYPSCSHYGYEAIQVHGAIKGSWLAIWRVMRCNPFNAGGFDYVPPKKVKNKKLKLNSKAKAKTEVNQSETDDAATLIGSVHS